ncbi:hypothetical protein Emed_004840 [Eimeria media]
MEVLEAPMVLQDVPSLPREGVFTHRVMIAVCSAILFLISSCASRLGLTGAQKTRRLAGDETDDEDRASLLTSCSRSQSNSSQSLRILESTSDDEDFPFPFVREQPSPRRPATGAPYGFLLIDGEDNRRQLQELMQIIYRWRKPHFGLLKRSCSVQIDNVVLQVEAKEVVRSLLWFGVCLEGSRPTGTEPSLRVQRKALRLSVRGGLKTVSNGFFVKEGILSEGRKGRLQIIVDASFAESPTPLEDIPQDGDDDETQQGAAGPSGSAGMQQSPPQTSPHQSHEASPQVSPQQLQLPVIAGEGSTLGPPQLLHPEDLGRRLYAFPEIPGEENRKALQDLFKIFYDRRKAHKDKATIHRVEEDWGGPPTSVAGAEGEAAAASAAPSDPQSTPAPSESHTEAESPGTDSAAGPLKETTL